MVQHICLNHIKGGGPGRQQAAGSECSYQMNYESASVASLWTPEISESYNDIFIARGLDLIHRHFNQVPLFDSSNTKWDSNVLDIMHGRIYSTLLFSPQTTSNKNILQKIFQIGKAFEQFSHQNNL